VVDKENVEGTKVRTKRVPIRPKCKRPN